MIKKQTTKGTKKTTDKKLVAKTKAKSSKVNNAKTAKTTTKKSKIDTSDDMGIVIVDDDITIDQEKVNEERRAYLEEARSQEAYD